MQIGNKGLLLRVAQFGQLLTVCRSEVAEYDEYLNKRKTSNKRMTTEVEGRRDKWEKVL